MLSTLLGATALLAPGGKSPAHPIPTTTSPGAVHAVAFITDSLSHGLVGDGYLSLNEAIQLHNNTLSVNQLSAAELQQIQLIPGTGTATLLTWAAFDGTSTPVVTIERDLDPIIDTQYGFYVSSLNEPTILDFSGPGLLHGIRAPANSVEFKDLIFSGGPYGIDVTQTDVAGQAGLILNNVHFENQVQFGIRITTTTPNAFGKLYAQDCTFVGASTAIINQENVAGRTTIFELRNCKIQGAQRGIELELGAGGTGRYTLDRLTIDASQSGIRLQRPTGGNRSALLETQHVDIRAPLCAQFACAPTGITWAMLSMWHLRAPAGGIALQIGALGDSVYGDLQELTLDGDTSVLAGGGPQPLLVTNVRCRNGAVGFGTTAAQGLAVGYARFENCTVQTQGSAAIPFSDCSVTGSLTGTPTAVAMCSNSYVQTAGAHVTQTGSLPQPQLGSMHLQPDLVAIGTNALFQADLPPGLFGVFLLGFTDLAPTLLPQPLHVYSQPANTFTVPGIYRSSQSYQWPIPNFQIFRGIDLVVQFAVLPDPNVQAPAVQLPPGRRFVLQ